MKALDTNILVYAHRTETPKHGIALDWILHLAEGSVPWGLPVFCIGEFIRVVTHRNVFEPPSTIEQAIGAVESLLACPTVRILNPTSSYFENMKEMLKAADAKGNLAFDAQIAAVCRDHGITDLVTDDRDFSRFPHIRVITVETEPKS